MVNRPNPDFRGFSGTIVVRQRQSPATRLPPLPSGRSTHDQDDHRYAGEVERAEAGDSVTVTLTDEIDISRGDILAARRDRPQVADQFEAHLIWM